MMPDAAGYVMPSGLSEPELVALQSVLEGGHWAAHILYTQVLRRHVDRRTGVVGDKRIVSYQQAIEVLEKPGKRGRGGGAFRPSRSYISRQFSALEKAGLIERLERPDTRSPLRYYLAIACGAEVRAQEFRHVNRHVNRNSEPEKTATVTSICSRRADIFDQNKTPNFGTPPVNIQQQQGGGFSMDDLAAVDLEMVVRCYHEVLPGLPRARKWDNQGYRLLVARAWYMDERHQSEHFWRNYFKACAASDFLMGRVAPNPRRGPFQAHFKKLVEPETVTKVLNGEYT